MDTNKENLSFGSQWILITACLSIVTLILIKTWQKKDDSPFHTKVVPKVPGAYPLIGHGLQIAKNQLEFLQRCSKTHGNIFRIQLFKWSAVIIGDFETWKAVTALPEDHLSSRAYSASLPLKIGTMGDNNIFSEKIHRTPIKKSISFHPSFISEVQDEAELMLERIKSKYFAPFNNSTAEFDVQTEMLEYVCNSFTRPTFGFKLDTEAFKLAVELRSRITTLMQLAALVPSRLLNIITEKYTRKTRDELHYSFQKQISNYRSDPSANNTGFMQECVDFIDKKTGELLTDSDICGVMSVFLYVGLQAAVLLTNLIADLILNPSWLEKAKGECQFYLESGNLQGLLESPLIDALFWESARMNSGAISQVKAVLHKDVNVDGYCVGDADIIALSGPLVLEAVGNTELSKFDPTRFYGLKGNELTRLMSIINFSSGPTFCTGRNLAVCQIKLGLAQLLFKMDFLINKTVISEKQPGAGAMLSRNVTLAGSFR